MECTNYFMRHEPFHFDEEFSLAARNHHARKVARQASERAKSRHQSFKKFLGTFTTFAKDKEIRRFDLDRKFQWNDVQNEANAAVEAYSAPDSFLRNPVRYLSRSFTQNASTLEVLLHFVPDGEYTSILCGALTLVFNVSPPPSLPIPSPEHDGNRTTGYHANLCMLCVQAAKRVDSLRKRILGCLAALPTIVHETAEYRDLYHDDEDLWQAAEDLYLGILEGIEAMLQWMDESAFKKAVKAFFHQDSYGKKIEDEAIKSGIEDAASNFRAIVEFCLHKSVRSIERHMEILVTHVAAMEKQANWYYSTPHAPIMVVKTCFIDVYGLQRIMAADPELVRRDLTLALADALHACPPALHAHATTLLHRDEFRHWFLGSSSALLLVNGCLPVTPEQETASPLTTVAGTLYGTLSASPAVLPLFFPCGQHLHPHDPFTGLAGLLRALNAQLLLGDPAAVDTSAVDYPFVHALEAFDLPALGRLFAHLLAGSPRRAVFVLIDGFTLVEGSASALELRGFTELLRQVTGALPGVAGQPPRTGPVVKVLVTNADSVVYLDAWRNQDVVDLEPDAVLDDGLGLDMYETSAQLLGF
ncbi:uncharacterized protein BP01DRAFT_402624 [Aspergillus saccharolyticus JOP 1030-1]|uniref:Uncharacterized protein n=1 Tax=Aspergillus saccharolyticus JOP 1030-1 TaxID=1450539 RepID=A0A318ZIJ1_9EURO|nr:hypothetical protein BP01DRAFT_402624 [Aspergillus saccharolyticus JOP 1030-1]PYH43520.1 hypothetical protein BP01DRAFT_402624 [Aspergillus saccharolyticus JOP 1030-1]